MYARGEKPMIGTAEQDAFILGHTFAIVTTLRKDASPTNSAIFVIPDGDDLTFSITEHRLKTRSLQNDPHIALTLADEAPPTATSLSKAAPPCNATI